MERMTLEEFRATQQAQGGPDKDRRRVRGTNRTTTADGITHDSKTEAQRWEELKLLQEAGEICGLRRQVDIGLIDAPMPVAGLEGEQMRMECVCVMTKDDPLTSHEVITPQLLSGRRVIGVTGDHSVDRQFEDQMVRADAVYERSCTSYFYALARNMVAAGGDVSIIDPVNGKADLKDGVVWRKFHPPIYHDMVVITHRGQPLGIAAKLFLDKLHEGLKPFAVKDDRAEQ